MNALDRWAELRPLRWFVIAWLLMLLATCAWSAAAEQAQVCDPSLPQPPLVLVIDGQTFPVERFEFDVGSRTMTAVRWQGVFCDGFEGS